MKRVGYLTEQIAELDNLYLAFWKARKGKDGKNDVELFRKNLYDNLNELRSQLLISDINVGNYNYFTIYDPKQRQICAAPFHERVMHHAIMNICHPFFERYQVFDSYACRKNKGTYAALDRAKSFQKSYKYFLKLDVRKFFDTVDHKALKFSIRRLFKDEKLIKILDCIIDCYHTKLETGLPIGNLTSQYFANHILAKTDHFVKENLKIKGYVRYMDDMVLWGNEKRELLDKGRILETFIKSELNQELKPFCLNSVDKGLPFLGYLLFPHTIKLVKRSRIRFSDKLKEYIFKFESSEWSEQKFQDSCLPLLAHTQYAFSRGFREKVIENINGQIPRALTV